MPHFQCGYVSSILIRRSKPLLNNRINKNTYSKLILSIDLGFQHANKSILPKMKVFGLINNKIADSKFSLHDSLLNLDFKETPNPQME